MVINNTKKVVISKNIVLAKSFWDKVFGMLLSRNSEGLILKTRYGIHTLFMKNKIDVVILDKNKKIVKLKKSLSPYNFFVWNPKYNTAVELRIGLLNKSGTELGDRLDF